jgi:hypothetical protein
VSAAMSTRQLVPIERGGKNIFGTLIFYSLNPQNISIWAMLYFIKFDD